MRTEAQKAYSRESARLFRSRHPEYVASRPAYNKEWRKKQAVHVKEYNDRYIESLEGRFQSTKNRALKMGIEFSLSREQLKSLLSLPCYYCGGELPRTGCGSDRIDSSKGYTFENCRPCCTQCNIAKCDYTEKEFQEWLLRIACHYLKMGEVN